MIWDKTLKGFLPFLCISSLLLAGQLQSSAQLVPHLPAWMSVNNITNGQIQLMLHAEPGVSRYVIESSPDLAAWTLVATNIDNNPTRLITLAAAANASFYRAARDPIPLFAYALAAKSNINMNGNSIITDSWNSQDTNQSFNGHYNGYVGTNGNMASIFGLVNIGNQTISGSLFLGPTASYVGSGDVVGTISTNWNLNFPDAALPNVTWLPAPGSSTAHDFTTTGFYAVNDYGTITVEPDVIATLNFTNTFFDPSSLTIKGGTTNSGTVILYHNQGSLTLSGNAKGGATDGRPGNFIYFGLPGVTNVALSGTSTLVGCIYAPEAALTLTGGGINNFVGSGVFNNITVFNHYSVHFDESLLTSGPFR